MILNSRFEIDISMNEWMNNLEKLHQLFVIHFTQSCIQFILSIMKIKRWYNSESTVHIFLLRLIVISQLCWYFHLTFATFVDFASDTFCWLIRKKHTFNVKRKHEYFLFQHNWIWMKKSHRKCFRGEEPLNLHYARPYWMDITSSVLKIERVCTIIYVNVSQLFYLMIFI